MEQHLVVLLLGVIATGITTLTVKIIFDWIKHGRGTPLSRCPDCSKIQGSVDHLLGKCHELQTCMIQEKMKVRTVEAEILEHKQRLDKGSATMEAIQKDIGEINTNIAVLLERSLKRRSSDNSDA